MTATGDFYEDDEPLDHILAALEVGKREITKHADDPTKIVAPWTPDTVDALNAFQAWGVMHPFTCGIDSTHGTGKLHATEQGWKCTDSECDYRQNWAHAFMADRDFPVRVEAQYQLFLSLSE